jgi:hypothetical protein
MSGKLDQALDDITQAQRRGARRRSNPRRSAGRPAAAAPIGGIQKNTKPARGSGAKPAPAKAAPTNRDSKIIVSNLVGFPQYYTHMNITNNFTSLRTSRSSRLRYVSAVALEALGLCSTFYSSPLLFFAFDVASIRLVCRFGLELSDAYSPSSTW